MDFPIKIIDKTIASMHSCMEAIVKKERRRTEMCEYITNSKLYDKLPIQDL